MSIGRQHTVQSSTNCALPAEQSTVTGTNCQHQAQVISTVSSMVNFGVLVNQLRTMVFLAAVGLGGASVAAELFLFRGEFIYIVPRTMSDEMTRFASRGEWKHFPEHTRYLDVDSDGVRDFVAVGFGATSGHGAQLRYHLRQDLDGTPRLGRWYWALVTAPDGTQVFEEFNR